LNHLFQITIIGAGVIGLAIAEAISRRYPDILLVEKNHSFGQETSSHNSEVIHAGIYYPSGLKKAVFCREGNALLYEFCKENGVAHRKTGKMIVAGDNSELGDLLEIKKRAESNDVRDLTFLSQRQIREMEPDVLSSEALFSPSTGIIDSHSLMRCLLTKAENNGAIVVYRSEITNIQYDGNFYNLTVNDSDYHIKTKLLINSAGLHADKVAAMVGMDIDKNEYRLKFCKGSYFSTSPSPRLHHLVYPVPVKNHIGLGVHATLDLAGRVRFGPDAEYTNKIDYSVDPLKKEVFHKAVSSYLRGVNMDNLHPDMSGIRPKLQGPDEAYRDFVIQEETEAGYPGLINLIGIESPGLTSCIPIAHYILSLIEEKLS
jgi:L-2-hydroxyglutarate oxidase LhgO